MWTLYSHGITQSFSLRQYPQLSVSHILLPRQCNQLITSQEPHKPKLAPSPYGLRELFWWLQALPDAPLSPARWGTAKLPHQGMPIWMPCRQTFRCLATADRQAVKDDWQPGHRCSEESPKFPGKAVSETNFLSKWAGMEPPLSPWPSWRENKGNTPQQGFKIRYPTMGQQDLMVNHHC